jgi:hypothetical protein
MNKKKEIEEQNIPKASKKEETTKIKEINEVEN